MKFPDPNIGYVFGYDSKISDDRILVTFLGGVVKIPFSFNAILQVSKATYNGGRISWDVVRWGKCPSGTEALKIVMKKGPLRDHMIVFNDLNAAVRKLKEKGISVN